MHRLLTIMALMLAPLPALADQTVTYTGEGGRDLVLEIDDSGAVRVTGTGGIGDAAIIRDGELFLIGKDKDAPRVVRMRDLAAAMSEAIGPFFKALFEKVGEQIDKGRITITPEGSRAVGGYSGKAYSIAGLDDRDPKKTIRWIASDDPALKPAGAAMKSFIDLTLVMATPFLGEGVEAMLAENAQLFALGTPLDAGGRFRLDSVKGGDIDDARFVLPAEPVSREALLTEMKPQEPSAK